MRLIDADKLELEVFKASYWDNQDEDVIWQLVQDAPTVDAVLKEQYEELREAFVDCVCSGTSNLSPYCRNRCIECVDSRGWCTYKKCRGFNPDGRVYDEV